MKTSALLLKHHLPFVISDVRVEIIITASHNRKSTTATKRTGDDGAQMIAPHDENVIKEVEKIKNVQDIKFEGNKDLIEIIGKEMDQIYLERIKTLILSPEAIERNKDLKIVYTPIHGTGIKLVPDALRVHLVSPISLMCLNKT